MIHEAQTVGQIAARQPSTVQIFEEFGIHYCCHGEETLASACRSVGRDVDEVLARLRNAGTASSSVNARWVDPILEGLIWNLLRTSEAIIHEMLPGVEHALRALRAEYIVCETKLAETIRLTAELVHAIKLHLSQEAREAFPSFKEIERAYVGDTAAQFSPQATSMVIEQMLREHQAIGDQVSALREQTRGFTALPDSSAAYRELCRRLKELDHELRLKIHLENNILFERASQMSAALRVEPDGPHN